MKASLIPHLVLLCSGLALSDVASSSHLPFSQSTGAILTATRPTNVLFHPSTGKCVVRTLPNGPLKVGPCDQSDAWGYTQQKFLTVKGTYFCLNAVGSEKPAKLTSRCFESPQWDLNSSPDSDVKTHISTHLGNGNVLCLAVGPDDALFTSPCVSSDAQLFEFTTKEKVQVLG